MTIREIEEQRREIEKMTGRTVNLIATTLNGKPAVFIDINERLYRCVLLSELYWSLSDVYCLIDVLKNGKNPVEF